ncbi:MAG: RES family NAD+ phosphorylase [Ilumatobacteraceae bacterium]
MKLWRLTRPAHVALDGAGAKQFGGRYSSPGQPIVSFASEAGLAVLVALRYVGSTAEAFDEEYVLGWTEADCLPERAPTHDNAATKAFVDQWAATRRSLLVAVQSAVLPEADVILMNPRHPDAAHIAPLTVRPFRFADCLHHPPMLDHYSDTSTNPNDLHLGNPSG